MTPIKRFCGVAESLLHARFIDISLNRRRLLRILRRQHSTPQIIRRSAHVSLNSPVIGPELIASSFKSLRYAKRSAQASPPPEIFAWPANQHKQSGDYASGPKNTAPNFCRTPKHPHGYLSTKEFPPKSISNSDIVVQSLSEHQNLE